MEAFGADTQGSYFELGGMKVRALSDKRPVEPEIAAEQYTEII